VGAGSKGIRLIRDFDILVATRIVNAYPTIEEVGTVLGFIRNLVFHTFLGGTAMQHATFQARVRRGITLGAFIAAVTTIPVAVSAGELTIYSTIDSDNLKVLGKTFSEEHPGIKVKWLRDSTGIMHARMMAEKDNPRADVLYGLAATSMLTMDKLDMFIPYTPKGVEKLDARYRDKNDPAHWTGIYGWAAAICFNTIEAKKNNLPKPTKWADLTNPVYRGHITMPNPASSGTGFLDVSSWMQIWDEKRAWAYMDELHKNIASYTHSGSTPCKQAASGSSRSACLGPSAVQS
jgi:iron(III) transport system substrate-binding protein